MVTPCDLAGRPETFRNRFAPGADDTFNLPCESAFDPICGVPIGRPRSDAGARPSRSWSR
jgi:hypothetical protein